MSTNGTTLRRGLPRTPGGDPWPAGGAAAAEPAPAVTDSAVAPAEVAPATVAQTETTPAAKAQSVSAPVVASGAGPELRRGLPRTSGGEPWPPAGMAALVSDAPAPVAAVSSSAAPPTGAEVATTAPAATAVAKPAGPRAPLPQPRTVKPGKYAFIRPAPAAEPERFGPFTKAQWAGIVVIGGGALLVLAGMAVLLVRFLLSTSPFQDFLTAFPGEYHLPEGAPVGFPPWLAWQHFFNFFLMVLIIRTGLKVRFDQRPSAYFTGRGKNAKKISLSAWLHQGLDIFWITNGVIFIVLLFVTGQWMRLVPTSWEVFPNAISALLQYVSLDWPTDNGWVNYNSLQQLAYFTTVFIAAPLAVITGFRMSGLWPHNAKGLNRIYPVEWARALHFPVMLYFVLFIIVHVALVFSTGALRNLNHMYAAQGSVDPSTYANNWTGFWMFVLSLVAIAAAWIAARPMVVAPIAKLFGTVSAR
jgi:thiosulfate reductase cytochrome b subunit